MVIRTSDYKKTSPKGKVKKNTVKKIKTLSYTFDDNLEYWVNFPEDFNRCKQAHKCEHDCAKVLDHTFTKRLIRIASFSQIIGIYWDEYQKLCDSCREEFFKWYYNECWKDKPQKKTSKEIFEFEILENNLKDSYDTAKNKYQNMLRDYRYDLAKISKEEIESQKRFVDHSYEVWQSSLIQLREEIGRQEAVQKGYDV